MSVACEIGYELDDCKLVVVVVESMGIPPKLGVEELVVAW